jgi:hypothetical protein
MGDDNEVHLRVTYASHLHMDAAFCARMRIAITAGLESAPTGVINAWNQEAQIRPSRASLTASLFAGRYGLLVDLIKDADCYPGMGLCAASFAADRVQT